MVVDPGAPATKVPEDDPIVAMAVAAELHVPPVTGFEKLVEPNEHKLVIPAIAPGASKMLTGRVVKHPVGMV